ncbi:MAG: hypothetical protein ACREBI_11645 [Nitrosotalea sp.]
MSGQDIIDILRAKLQAKEKYKPVPDNSMSWMPSLILAVLTISLIVIPSFAQSESTYGVKDPISGQSYNVNYNITNATVSDMSIDTQETSLVVSLQTTSDGTMTITLPRTLIDAKTGASDDQFFVLEDGAEADFQETKTNTDRTLSISFPDGTEKVEIIGTQVVPEFGSLAWIIITISIIGTIVISTRLRLFQKARVL